MFKTFAYNRNTTIEKKIVFLQSIYIYRENVQTVLAMARKNPSII